MFRVYIAVAQTGAAPSVQPGIYKVAATGGTPTVFALPPVGSAFGFVNGLDFVDTDLYATDSTGKIFKVSNLGVTIKWLEDNALAGDEQDCKLGNGFPIGANGIAHDANNIYVVNTDKGTLLKIPSAGGDAGTITQVVKDPQLCGADGLVIDKDGSFLIAVNAKDTIDRPRHTCGRHHDHLQGSSTGFPCELGHRHDGRHTKAPHHERGLQVRPNRRRQTRSVTHLNPTRELRRKTNTTTRRSARDLLT